MYWRDLACPRLDCRWNIARGNVDYFAGKLLRPAAQPPGAFYSQTGVLSDPSVRPCVCVSVRHCKVGDSPNSISIGFTAPSGGIISRVDFRNLKKIEEKSEKPNEGRISRDPVLGPFLRPFLKIKITQCVTATKR